MRWLRLEDAADATAEGRSGVTGGGFKEPGVMNSAASKSCVGIIIIIIIITFVTTA